MSFGTFGQGMVTSVIKIDSKILKNQSDCKSYMCKIVLILYLYNINILKCFHNIFLFKISDLKTQLSAFMGFPGGSVVKNPPANVGHKCSIPGSGRSLGVGNGKPLQYSCLENPTEGEAWQVTIHGVPKESDRTYRLKNTNKCLHSISCLTWDLVQQPRLEPRLSALGAWSLSHWPTREVPVLSYHFLECPYTAQSCSLTYLP